MTQAADKDTAHRFPCDQCGADMRFDPAAGRLKCDHCGFEADGPGHTAEPVTERDYARALGQGGNAEEAQIRLAKCDNCGASFEFERDTHAAECPFCAAPIVTDTGAVRQIKPRGLLPFALTEREGRAAMTRWLGRLWFAPNGLQEYARKGRALTGIYAPHWTYDAATATRYRGQRGEIHHETRRVQRQVDGKAKWVEEQVQKIRWYPASGRVARDFDDVLVLGSKSLPRSHTDALAPWPLKALVPYSPEHLAGFRAEGYTIGLADGFGAAQGIMEHQITRDIEADIGGDRQVIDWRDTDYRDITFKHILLPVWLAAYRFRGKTYRFVVNGQTGKVSGERPWSGWKIFFALVLALLVGGIVAAVIAASEGQL